MKKPTIKTIREERLAQAIRIRDRQREAVRKAQEAADEAIRQLAEETELLRLDQTRVDIEQSIIDQDLKVGKAGSGR